ncbi:13748_t:CDS:2 [Entrophospora sp. SA101]|nr:13748_t:CDS:2 [Entrophospora sp. SA101]
MYSAIENISPAIIKRISKELNILVAQPPEGIRVIVNELDVCDIQAWILGPEGTPYEGGMFKIKVVLGTDFPSKNPTASISSDNSNLSNITPKKRVASSDKKLDKKQADKKRSMKRL